MNSTQLYDVLFLDITVSNLLSAVTIFERFEGIKIKILYDGSFDQLESVKLSMSAKAWNKLQEVNPKIEAIINSESPNGSTPSTLMAASLLNRFIGLLPRDTIAMNDRAVSMEEGADLVVINTESGCTYRSKIVIDGRVNSLKTSPSGYTEAQFMCTTSNPGHEVYRGIPDGRLESLRPACAGPDVYIEREKVRGEVDLFACLIRSQSTSRSYVMDKVRSQIKLEELSETSLKSFFVRPLLRAEIESAHGRIAVAGELNLGIPFFSVHMLEQELEQALLLKKALLLKGLTAAALSEWKRCRRTSSAQELVESPMDMFGTSEEESRPDRDSDQDSSMYHMKDIEKPLVCNSFKPFMVI